MASAHNESVADPQGLLAQDDHMRGMERIRMEVARLAQPFPSVTRVTGRIAPQDPAQWIPANLAVRIEVETPEGERPVSRVYTVRSFDPVQNLIEIDFVMHEDDSPAMRWLRAAVPGTLVWMTGPRQHFIPDHEAGKRAAIFADETAIPAVCAILKAWPEGAKGSLWVETGDREAFDELPGVEGVERHLLLRSAGEAAGSTGRLFAAAKAAVAGPADWTIWAAGERQEMRDLRNHFRAGGFDRNDVRVYGYWKRGSSSSEIDRIRLEEYTALRARGEKLEDFRETDLPI